MMKYNSMSNQAFAALGKGLPVPLTVTFEGTGAGTAWISGNLIIIDITTVAQLGKYFDLSTPIDFDFLNMWSIHGDGTANVTLTAKNSTASITDAVAVTTADKTIDRITTVDDDYIAFVAGDDDLRIAVGTAAFLGIIVIEIDK